MYGVGQTDVKVMGHGTGIGVLGVCMSFWVYGVAGVRKLELNLGPDIDIYEFFYSIKSRPHHISHVDFE